MTRPVLSDLDALAIDLATDALLLDVPDPERPGWGTGYRTWWLGDQLIPDHGDPLEVAAPFMRDVYRRGWIRRQVEARGLPAELVELAWERLPYESEQLRHPDGWARWWERRHPGRRWAA